MKTERYLSLKKRRREIERTLEQKKDENLKAELKRINLEIEKDPPTVDQVYISIGD